MYTGVYYDLLKKHYRARGGSFWRPFSSGIFLLEEKTTQKRRKELAFVYTSYQYQPMIWSLSSFLFSPEYNIGSHLNFQHYIMNAGSQGEIIAQATSLELSVTAWLQKTGEKEEKEQEVHEESDKGQKQEPTGTVYLCS
jgi:hypothetical protein|uniref:Uncharacterized protein n=1 Tax=Zea mays TaxID=4577 RepID=A0A804LFE5_MAIZE